MKIFKTAQIKELDKYTIEEEPIPSYDLMKRAVKNMFNTLLPFLNRDQTIYIVAGPGNNGGDALVLAKMLRMIGANIHTFIFDNGKHSNDCLLAQKDAVAVSIEVRENKLADLTPCKGDLVIEGLFGAGLSRPITGEYAEVIKKINDSGAEIWAIDIPSGLMGEDNSENNGAIIKATKTFTFQQPKLAFMFSENNKYIGELYTIDINLHPKAIESIQTDYSILEQKSLSLKSRNQFSHKGTYGHGLLIAGQYGMAGACILSSTASLRMGIGLLTAHIPSQIYGIIQATIPEAIISFDEHSEHFSHISINKPYSAIGIGPGLGTDEDSYRGFLHMLQSLPIINGLIVDADGLNIISQHKDLLSLLPPLTIITPHPKEFDRICGPSKTSYERMEKGIALAKAYNLIVVIKGANTNIIMPDGRVFFNPTGNPGMATAGSGDVLTGIILSLLAQSYSPEEAAKIGVYLHGLAGDIAAENLTEESLIASDIIKYLPNAIKRIKDIKKD